MAKMIDVQGSHCKEAAKTACAGSTGAALNTCLQQEYDKCIAGREAANTTADAIRSGDNNWGMSPVTENLMGDDAFSFEMVEAVPSASAIATACDTTSPDMQKRGESFVPLGWGPTCNPSQEMGTAEAQICFGNVYLAAYEKCLSQQLASMHGIAATETKDAETRKAGNYGDLRKISRGADGIAYATNSTPQEDLAPAASQMQYAAGQNVNISDCFPDDKAESEDVGGNASQSGTDKEVNPFVQCMCAELAGTVTKSDPKEPTQYEEPLTGQFEYTNADVSTSGVEQGGKTLEETVVEAIGTKFDKCLQRIPETNIDGETATPENKNTGYDVSNNGFPPPAGAELGIDKYSMTRCACTQCIVVTDHSETVDGSKTSASDTAEPNTTNTDDDVTTVETTTEDSSVIPLAFGVNIVSGVMTGFDEKQFKACASTQRFYTARFKLARNRQAAVTRVFHGDTDVSSQVSWQVFDDIEGSSVVVYNIPSAWSAAAKTVRLSFETVEAYEHELSADVLLQTSALYDRMVVRPEHNRVYTVNRVTKQLTFLDYNTFEVTVDDFLIPDNTLFFVSPTGDIITRVAGSTSLTIYSPVSKFTTTIDNIFSPDVTELYFTADGWFDYREVAPYQYDDFLGNPVYDYGDWHNLSNIRRLGSAYLIHPNKGYGDDDGDQYVSVVVPAHVADLDLARPYVRYFARSEDMKTCYGAYNNDVYDTRTLVKRHTEDIELFEFPQQYPTTSVLNTNTKVKVTDERGDVPVATARLKIKNCFADTTLRLLISNSYGSICVLNYYTQTAQFFMYNTALTYNWSYGVLGNSYTRVSLAVQSPHTVISIPLPAGNVAATTLVGKDAYYIATTLDIIKVDLHNRSYTVVGTLAEGDTITAQVISDTPHIVYTAGGKIKKCLVYAPTEFDVAEAVKRMFTFYDQECVVTQAVPSYLRGFTVADDVDAVVSNICKMTTLMVHRHNGDGTTICRNRTTLDMDEYAAHKTFSISEFSSHAPAVFVSAVDAETGLRTGVQMIGASETNTLFKTGANTSDLYAVATNVQVHLTDKRNFTTAHVPLTHAIEAEYDTVEIDTAAFQLRVEHTNVDGSKLVPPVTTTPPLVKSSNILPIRPVYTNIQAIDDLSTVPFGFFVGVNRMRLHNMTPDILKLLKTKQYIIFGVRNFEKLSVQNVVAVGGNEFELIGVRRGADNTDMAVKYNKTMDAGLFVIIPNNRFVQKYSKFITIPQIGRNIILPVSQQAVRRLPPPINLHARNGEISWHTRVRGGAGKFLLIFWWSEWRDYKDARYLFNSVQKHGYTTMQRSMSDPSNRFLHMVEVDGYSTPIPITAPPTPLKHSDSFSLSLDGKHYGDIVQGYTMPQYVWDGYAKFAAAHWTPQFTYQFNTKLYSDHWDDLFSRVGRPNAYNMTPASDKANKILTMEGLPNLATLFDYWGNPAKWSGAVRTGFDQPPDTYYTDLPEGFSANGGFDPSTGYTVTVITPLRRVLELLLFPAYDKDGTGSALGDYKNAAATRNAEKFWDHPDYAGASFAPEFMRRITVIYLLLDQYHLGIPIPNDRYQLLAEYGVAPPFSLKVHDPHGKWITDFLNETMENHSPYPKITRDGKLNILIAEKQTDGKYGHFELFEGVPIENHEGITCGKAVLPDTPNLTSHKTGSYIVMEGSTPRLLRFSMTYAVAPFVPFVASEKNHKTGAYAVVNKLRTRTLNTCSYAVIHTTPLSGIKEAAYAVIGQA